MAHRSTVSRWFIRFNAGDSWLKRTTLRLSYYTFIMLPYPLRRLATSAFIIPVLGHWEAQGLPDRANLGDIW